MEKISISARAAASVARNNLWIFSNEIHLPKGEKPKIGAWCWFEHNGRVIGTGYYNPHSLIAGRVLTREKIDDRVLVLEQHLTAAFERRRALMEQGSCRLVFSEADFIPGLIFDCYGLTGVLQTSTAGMDDALADVQELVPRVYKNVFGKKLEALVVRADSSIRTLEGVPLYSKIIFGDEEKVRQGTFVEGDVQYAADYLEGQKTGFFLDQRDNRGFLKRSGLAKGGHVLDLFCYSGGWGLSALRGGASQVTFVDESGPALELVKKGIELNRFDPAGAKMVQSDAFEFLESDKNEYDVVVLDPPAFVKSKKTLPQAKAAYEKCNRLALRRLKRGGVLLTSSCSYHLPTGDFLELVSQACGKENTAAHVIYQGAQAADHPILISMPETRYLKCLGIKKL